MLVPPPREGWRPHLGEILNPPLLSDTTFGVMTIV